MAVARISSGRVDGLFITSNLQGTMLRSQLGGAEPGSSLFADLHAEGSASETWDEARKQRKQMHRRDASMSTLSDAVDAGRNALGWGWPVLRVAAGGQAGWSQERLPEPIAALRLTLL